MKVAVIGSGNVGKTIFHDLQYTGRISQITLVGRNKNLLRAEIMDARDAAVLRESYGPKLFYGGYEGVADADIIIYTAGTSAIKKDRMDLLHDNCVIAESVFTEVNRYNREAIILCVTNPLDVITMKIQQVTEQDPHRVIGSGSLLETARLVRLVAEFLELSDRSIHMSVVGEHGASAVALLSSVRVMGLTLEEYFKRVTDDRLLPSAKLLNEAFRKEAFRIFNGKGYTSTGVSATVCRIVSAIAADTREILPVSSVLQGEYGLRSVALSVPSVIGRNGIEDIPEVMMAPEEKEAFLASAEIIRRAALSEGIIA